MTSPLPAPHAEALRVLATERVPAMERVLAMERVPGSAQVTERVQATGSALAMAQVLATEPAGPRAETPRWAAPRAQLPQWLAEPGASRLLRAFVSGSWAPQYARRGDAA
jgi:hypothetical protein